MNKAKRHARNFINHLFGTYQVPRIPVYIHWRYNTVINNDDEHVFGLFCYDDGDNPPCIHVAGRQIGNTGVMSVIAHEFVHYLQHLHGRDMDNVQQVEADADYFGAGLFGKFLINKKDKHMRIDGTLKAWEERTEVAK